MKSLEEKLFYLSILLLPTQLGKHFWPQFSYLYSLKVDYLSPTIYVWDFLVVFLMLVFLYNKPKINRTSLNLTLIFILLQSLSMLPAIFSNLNGVGEGLVKLEQFVIISFFGIYIASQEFNSLAQRIFWPLCLGIGFVSMLAILQFINASSIGFWILGERSFSLSTPAIAKFDFQGLQFLRPYSIFPHPNSLAAFIVITLPLLYILKPVALTKKVLHISYLISTIALILTMSRTAILIGIVESLIFLKNSSAALLLSLFILLSPFLIVRFSTLFTFDNLSVTRREQLNKIAFETFKTNPVFGVGLNRFIVAGSDQLLVGQSRFLQPVHNIFLLTLSETGIVGFFSLVLLLGFPIYKLLKGSRTRTNTILLSLWIFVVFLGMFDHYFLTQPQPLRLLFLLWGLSLSKF